MDNLHPPVNIGSMTTAPQLIIVETLFPATRTKRASYVLVLSKEPVAAEPTPEEEARAFTLGVGRPQSAGETAAIFDLSQPADEDQAFHRIREGVLLEAEEVTKRPADQETPAAFLWLVAEV